MVPVCLIDLTSPTFTKRLRKLTFAKTAERLNCTEIAVEVGFSKPILLQQNYSPAEIKAVVEVLASACGTRVFFRAAED